MTQVELHPAFFWICDDCGRDNFVRARTVEPESDEGRELHALVERVLDTADEIAEPLGIEPDGIWVTRPEEVMCQYCRAVFTTTED